MAAEEACSTNKDDSCNNNILTASDAPNTRPIRSNTYLLLASCIGEEACSTNKDDSCNNNILTASDVPNIATHQELHLLVIGIMYM